MVTGILADGLAGFYLVFWMPFTNLIRNFIGENAPFYILGLFMPVVLGLSITAVVCDSVDLKRVKAGSLKAPRKVIQLKCQKSGY